ncbi:Uncharacterised protein [Enterobacter hormaechei]|nr:Uncharacterised protein [Enterobacter hormaechei]CZV52115.1 Uncharacterised protein [Enterobacter hormaechei]CZV82703.1 Uncharacterised protein [Enterobacter hormaechei]CZV83658.1 Uncharacterised protein [Enterobacter hormaechei]CZZ25013.1 Uncharacterised protein [Enterobacter hormaechei]
MIPSPQPDTNWDHIFRPWVFTDNKQVLSFTP